MKVPAFILFSSAMLTVWLGATFVREVPVETYPKKTKVTPGVLQTKPTEASAVPVAPAFARPDVLSLAE